MYPCHASRLSVTICPIKMPLLKMRCFMPESYNVLKICLEVIVAIDDYIYYYSQFNYVFTSTNAKFINRQFHEVSDAMLGYIFINFSLLTAAAL